MTVKAVTFTEVTQENIFTNLEREKAFSSRVQKILFIKENIGKFYLSKLLVIKT